ncbi:MAG TPA: hypothetical protein VMY38_01080 [Gemmatimonadaceae bacterium]|nr:hypothetical protein [Gemmatimonadaceae bacterium]
MKRSQITAYLPWQLWDFAVDRGIAILFTGGLMGMSIVLPGHMVLTEHQQLSPEALTLELFKAVVAQTVSIFVVIAASGIVANDRVSGSYRFLFSKPVRQPVYYALQFAITLLGVLIAGLILLSIFWVLVGWASPVVPLIMITVSYLALGGPIFFFSTFTRFDWALLVVLWGGSAIARTVFSDSSWYQVAQWILPPVHHIDKLRGALFADTPVDVGGVVWLIGYGMLFFLAGLVMLERKAIAE